jgi:peptidoglycan/xylan/chitin deacetylase (PgdA/CDA1 family)
MWWIVAIGTALITLAHTAPFPFLLEYAGPDRSVWRLPGGTSAPIVYLTYDDGPNPDVTPALLDVLAQQRASATFFIIPKHVTATTAPIVARAVADGHAVAMHSHSRMLLLYSPDRLARLFSQQAGDIERLAGVRPCPLFRPHAGWRGGQLYAGLERSGYKLAGWSFGMWDWNWWRPARPERLVDRLAARAADGDIIVMHDGPHDNPRADRGQTIAATAALIPLLRARGFRFGDLCEAASRSVPPDL